MKLMIIEFQVGMLEKPNQACFLSTQGRARASTKKPEPAPKV